MLIANLILFAFSAGSLYYVIRYRIHIYATYELRDRKPKKRVSAPVPSRGEISDTDEIVKALVALGAKTKDARSATLRAFENSPDQDFDHVLRVAIQECQRTKK